MVGRFDLGVCLLRRPAKCLPRFKVRSHPDSPKVLELYRERTISTISEIKTGSAVRSRYNDLKVAAAAAASL